MLKDFTRKDAVERLVPEWQRFPVVVNIDIFVAMIVTTDFDICSDIFRYIK